MDRSDRAWWLNKWRCEVTLQCRVVAHLLRWAALGAVSGALAGVMSYAFLEALHLVTDWRVEHGWIVLALPVAGVGIGIVYHRWGGRSAGGNSLILEEIHTPTAWLPRRMAPLVFGGTVVSHLFGASVGREGTAIQMSGSMTDWLARAMRLNPADRRLLLIAAIAGGFGSVFGVPLAGAVFALEVQAVGRIRYEALVPALVASVVGDLVVSGLGYDHPARPQMLVDLDAMFLLKVAAAGIAFGLVSTCFGGFTHVVKATASRFVPWPPARLAIGGAATVALMLLVGRDYLGLSLPLIDDTLAGISPGPTAFAWKLVFTVIALGCGFPGGEVTPLFVIGTTLGAALATPLGIPVATLGSIGFVAVFAGAANTPLACTIMGVELFGRGAVVPIAFGCVIAYVTASHRGIYSTQRITVGKGHHQVDHFPTVADWHTANHQQRPPRTPS